MATGRFDECCPHCGKPIENLHGRFVNNDYGTEFRLNCPHCKKEIQCDVHTVPEFELSIPETAEQWAKKVEAAQKRYAEARAEEDKYL